ncbi:MAG TPA: hypothetical protein VGI44_11560, partial [Acidimicrobiales bacterium]
MAKLLYSATVSPDGFIAGQKGDMSWLTEHLGPNPTIDEVIGEIGSILIGHRTFGGDDPHKGTPGEGVRLFEYPGGTNVKLERIGLTQSPGATNLWLRVV